MNDLTTGGATITQRGRGKKKKKKTGSTLFLPFKKKKK